VVLPFKKEVYRVEDLNYLYSNIGQGYSLPTRCGRFVYRVNRRQQMRTFAVRLLQPSALFILLFVVEIQ